MKENTKSNPPNHSEERRMLRSLVTDIESMLRRPRTNEFDEVDKGTFFGPFQNYYDESSQTLCEGPGVTISWPNLSILLEEAKSLLKHPGQD